ncbi:MAG: SMC-Scp complex subunit ScpB [Erysipelotrichaceae bacterium]|nr:SMC-Scp complex subunit ScpB [Erysipelotrichaceae bacterium]MDP3306318.1 SMC-Scp complex subunit ScpB [Erysipelotrichaceae bacterium]
MTDYTVIIEGLLFIVGEQGLSIEQMAQTLLCSEEEVIKAVDQLAVFYKGYNRGIQCVNYGGQVKLLTAPFIHPYAQQMLSIQKTRQLSQSALETLAIIAYKQPITRVEIEEIRGVGCDIMLRKLQALDLIREFGRSEAPGRPILYEVTQEFMDVFQLMSLDELPKLEQIVSGSSQELFE